MQNYEWKSDFSSLINEFLAQYRLAGFKFEKQEIILQHFDRFCSVNGYSGPGLKKYVLEEFIYDKREQKSTHYAKEVVMIQFADFLQKRGHSAYRIDHRYSISRSRYIPHIYTAEEKRQLFFAFCSEQKHIQPEKMTFSMIDGVLITEFLDWLESERNCTVTTRNQRLVSLHSFSGLSLSKNLPTWTHL